MSEKMYSTSETAQLLGVSIRTFKRWRKSGKLIPAKTYDNGYNFYSVSQVEKILKGMTPQNVTPLVEERKEIIMEEKSTNADDLPSTKDAAENVIDNEDDTGIDLGDDWDNIPALHEVEETSDDTSARITTQTSDDTNNETEFIPMTTIGANSAQATTKAQPKTNTANLLFYDGITDADISAIRRMSYDRRKTLAVKINQLDLRKVFPPDRQGNGFICPNCGNGSGRTGDGIKPKFDDSGKYQHFFYHCFSHNDFEGKLTDIIKRQNNFTSKMDWYKILAIGKRLLDYAESSPNLSTLADDLSMSQKRELSEEELVLIRCDIEDAAQDLEKLPIDDRRGLTLETYRHFNCGFIAQWRSPSKRAKNEYVPSTPRIIIPTGEESYNAILIKSARNADNIKFKSLNAGHKEIFDFDCIKPYALTLIVEGEIDALSIFQATGGNVNVVALSGTGNVDKFIKRVEKKFSADVRENLSFLVMLDNDDAGIKAAKKLVGGLLKINCAAVFDLLIIGADKVDANDFLMSYGEDALKSLIEDKLNDTKTKLDDVRQKLSERKKEVQDTANDELDRLKALPPSKDRNEQLIKAINDKLYLTPQRKRAHKQWIADSLQENADLIFSYDPVIDGLVGYDEFYRQYTFLKPVFWREGNCAGEQWTDADDKKLRRYFQQTYQNFKGAELIDNNFTYYSDKKSFHPIKQYLESLHWDGTPRAETYFSKFLNIDDTPYTREITRKWLLGAISRIYHEGCDFQFALVLHGKQGIGKGYCLRMLGQSWYVSLVDSLDDSHAIDTIERGWIVEIAELAAGRKAELNAQKAFLSANADTRRKAYARRAETIPRHCVFAISVNDEHFLRDLTGNRRYKILESRSKQNEIVEGLTDEYVDQVWAEVFVMYQKLFRNGFNDQLLRLSREVDVKADEIANKHLQDDGLQGEIEAFLDKPILPSFVWERLTKEERRKFFVDGHIILPSYELNFRIRSTIKNKNKAQDLINTIGNWIHDSDNFVRKDAIPTTTGTIENLTFYGSVLRTETCAAEIFNECFGNDRRKSMNRINEVLSTLDGWKRQDRYIRNFANVYGHQNIQYVRKIAPVIQ